jgi:hypothetical protein
VAALSVAAGRVRALFRRQLAVPLAGCAATLAEYTAWEAAPPAPGVAPGILPPPVAAAAAKAAASAAARAALEAPLQPPSGDDAAALAAAVAARRQDAGLLRAYEALLSHEGRSGDPSRVSVAFERALAEFGTTPSLWARHAAHAAAVGGPGAGSAVYTRALRCVPWHGGLWAGALRCAERCADAAARLEATHAAALAAGLPGPEDHIQVGLARMDAARRAGDAPALRAAAVAALDGAQGTIPADTPPYVDAALRVPAYWAACELKFDAAASGGGADAARAVWEALLKRPGYGACAEAWLAYAAHECAAGGGGAAGAAAARRVYKRVFSRRLDCAAPAPPPGASCGQEALCRAWLRTEREHGAPEDYAAAEAKVAPILEELQASADAAAAAAHAAHVAAAEKAAKPPPKVLSPAEMKRMRQEKDPNYAAKAAKLAAAAAEKAEKAGAGAGAGAGADEEAPAAPKGKKRGAGEEEAAAPSAKRAKPEHAPSAGTAGAGAAPAAAPAAAAAAAASSPPAAPRYDDSLTVFVKNLPRGADEAAVSAFFVAAGAPSAAVRLPRDRATGALRGFGYLEFASEAALDAALALQAPTMDGRLLSLARSKPPGPVAGAGGGGRGGGFVAGGRAGGFAGRGGDGGGRGGRGGGGGGRPGVGATQRRHLDVSDVPPPAATAASADAGGGAAAASAPAAAAPSALGFKPRVVAVAGVKSNADFRAKLLASKAAEQAP